MVLEGNDYCSDGSHQFAEYMKVDEDWWLGEQSPEEFFGMVDILSAFLLEEAGKLGDNVGVGVVELEEFKDVSLI